MNRNRPLPLKTLSVHGRPYTVFGSARGYVVRARPLPSDPTELNGGYHHYCYPHAVLWRIEPRAEDRWCGAGRGWGLDPPLTEGWVITDGRVVPCPAAVLGYAVTIEDAWREAAEALAGMIVSRFAAAAGRGER